MRQLFLNQRKRVHQQVLKAVATFVGLITSFVLVFSSLLLLSNWPAYSRILQDIIDPQAMAVTQNMPEVDQERLKSILLQQKLEQQHQETFSQNSGIESETEFKVSDMGQLYPPGMRLEVPKVFSGTVPIQNVDVENFDFKDLYESENKIQEALRDGVVHYPFTAAPDQYGNVFLTGHSSYTPWDPGRYKDIFALLHKLEVGDEYYITYKGKKYTYTVFEVFEIQPDDISVLNQPTDQKISTLMTCTPVGTNIRRLIVRADLTQVE